MYRERLTDIASFFLVGINYKKSDAAVRGKFSISADQYQAIISVAPSFGISEFFVLSTCNRTEIYGFAENGRQLAGLLCTQAQDSLEHFNEFSYTKSGVAAVEHLFNVASGLDSQILGDYEIVGQIRQAIKISRDNEFTGAYLERLLSEVFQTSKKIRTTTTLSGGTVSVSFAAVQYVKQYFKELSGKQILLIGTGKIGANTCKNIIDYLPGTKIKLINRSAEKAVELAAQFNLDVASIDQLQACVNASEVIIVATNAPTAVLTKENFTMGSLKLVIDLSVPCNVSPDVNDVAGIHLLNVDELSCIKDETLKKRSAEIPKVKNIIKEHMTSFFQWHEMRKHVPVLKAVKTHLEKMQSGTIEDSFVPALVANLCDKAAEEKIQKVINGMAVKMRMQNQRGCQYIEAMNDFITTASN